MATKFDFKFEVKKGNGTAANNMAQLVASLKSAPDRALALMGQVMYQLGEEIMSQSKAEYCPIDTGALRSSGRVTFPQVSGQDLTVTLGYGGAAAPYAMAVHETNKNYNNGKQWKYLETPFKAKAPDLPRRLSDAFQSFHI